MKDEKKYFKKQYFHLYIMNSLYVDVLGYVGGCVLSIQTIPQIIKSIKSNSSKDLSYLFLCINIFGLMLMTMYGILKHAPPLYIPTICSMILAIILLLIKFIQSNVNTTTEPTTNL